MVPTLPSEKICPDYWENARQELMKRDRILKRIIPRFGSSHLVSRSNPFQTLARSIIGQQISTKAADIIWSRILDNYPTFEPLTVIKADRALLKQCGLSVRKIEYLADLSKYFTNGNLHTNDLCAMSDEFIIKELMKIRGIGRWTAEMFLIFNLARPNILPLDDLGLLRAISLNYFSGEPVTRSEAREVAANWEPWCTVATWYLWCSIKFNF